MDYIFSVSLAPQGGLPKIFLALINHVFIATAQDLLLFFLSGSYFILAFAKIKFRSDKNKSGRGMCGMRAASLASLPRCWRWKETVSNV